MQLEEWNNIGRHIKISNAPIKTQCGWPWMSETFYSESVHDSIVIRSRANWLQKCSVSIRVFWSGALLKCVSNLIGSNPNPIQFNQMKKNCQLRDLNLWQGRITQQHELLTTLPQGLDVMGKWHYDMDSLLHISKVSRQEYFTLPHGFPWTPRRLLGVSVDSSESPHGVHEDSTETPWGVSEDSIVHFLLVPNSLHGLCMESM